jgi:hypothetical protein
MGGSYFAAFSTNRITIDLQNPPSPIDFFATTLQARQHFGAVEETGL